MPGADEKPYRVYRGGRQKGKVPLAGRDRSERRDDRASGVGRRAGRHRSWRRRILLTLIGLIVLLLIWIVAGYLSVRSGVADANKRLPAGTTAVLAKQSGLIVSSPTNILLLGTDH